MARKYFYDTPQGKVGPVSGEDLVRLRAAGEIDGDTWVRRENSSTWRHLSKMDLRKEEEAEANPSFWTMLRRHVPLSTLIIFVALAIVFVMLLVGLASVLWPVLLVLLVLWLLSRALK
ncbi:MAG: DUF4339 domain-containing protein [Akkermansia sp.]|nr:DUF4339 domain-containing protein [Akkermansia sp.]